MPVPIHSLSIPAVAAISLLLFPFCAQAQGVGQDRAAGHKQQDCEAPATPAQPGVTHENEGHDLSARLSRCGGVLQAPGLGDGHMVRPAPETGNQRVIKPGSLPQDRNPSNGAGNGG